MMMQKNTMIRLSWATWSFMMSMKVMMMRIDRDGWWPWPKQQVRVHFYVEVCLALSIGENEETKERRTEPTAIIRPISHESDSF